MRRYTEADAEAEAADEADAAAEGAAAEAAAAAAEEAAARPPAHPLDAIAKCGASGGNGFFSNLVKVGSSLLPHLPLFSPSPSHLSSFRSPLSSLLWQILLAAS